MNCDSAGTEIAIFGIDCEARRLFGAKLGQQLIEKAAVREKREKERRKERERASGDNK